MIGRIIDHEKFKDEHRHRVIHSKGKIRQAYLDRYEQYCFENGLKICKECYKTYEKDCQECSKGVK